DRQVTRTPDAVAVVDGDRSVTFAELDARANQLARCLAAGGVGPESIVGLALSPSIDLIVALTGALKAGAAYVPLDPDLPAARIAEIVDSARPALVLDALSTIDLEPFSSDAVTDADRLQPLLPQHPAYVIYTSGSTGRPKGVLVRHRELTTYLSWARDRY